VALTDKEIKALQPGAKPYWVLDDLGLELLVTRKNKRWYFRFRYQGKQQRIPIGPYGPPPAGVPIKAARAQAAEYLGMLRRGIDPRGEAPAPALVPEQPEHESVDDLIDRYIRERGGNWRPGTARTYRSAIDSFRAWCSSSGVLTVDQITAGALASFRGAAIGATRRVRTKGKGTGRKAVVDTGEKRSSSAINCQLRAVRTMLQAELDAERLPSIASGEVIKRNLKQVEGDEPQPTPLRSHQLVKLVAACRRHDLDHEPIGPFVVTMLLGGFRLGELLRLRWDAVDLEHDKVIRVRVGAKKKNERAVDLAVSPILIRVLEQEREHDGRGLVFKLTDKEVDAARQRLIAEYGAPAFHWSQRHSKPDERSPPTLRSTCECYLVCARGIYEASSLYLAARRLGHGTDVAEKHYLDPISGIPDDARTLEAAMQIEQEIEKMLRPRRRLQVVE